MAKKPEPEKTQKSDKAPVKQDGLSAIFTRAMFYRDGYRNLLKIVLVEAVAILALILALIFAMSLKKAEDRFFATTQDGRILEMVALDQPNLPDSAVLNWATQSATEVMTFGFHDYRKRLQESSRHFTLTGWQSFNQALSESLLLKMVEEKRQVVTAVVSGAPVVAGKGIVNGVLRWRIEFPLRVTYQVGTSVKSDTQSVAMIVVRVSTLETSSGLGIEQWVSRPYQLR